MRRIVFIVNPVSGTTHRKIWVEKAIKELGTDYETDVIQTQYRGHGHLIAKELAGEGTDTIVAVGGDGTVNEIGGAVIGSNTKLAIFPMGSGNGLARELGMSTKRAEKAIETIRRDNASCVDYGMAGDRPFFCTCGTGFDAEIARLFTGNTTRGFWQYLKLCVRTFFKFKTTNIEFELDGERFERSVFLFNAANIKQYGFGAQIAPMASVQDGLLDVTIVPKINILTALKLTVGMFTRRLHKMRPIETFKCSELTLKLPEGAPFHIDGDYIEPSSSTMTIKVIKGGIKVLV